MAFDISQVLGGMSSSGTDAVPTPMPRVPITNNRAHVDGGRMASSASANSNQSDKGALYDAAIIVSIALAFLWLSGAIVFRTHNI